MESSGMFPALLRHWRKLRGMSQLDLALAAEVSSRHLSFLETGRAEPSQDMVLRLCGALGVPLRAQNEMLRASGHAVAYAETSPEVALSPVIEQAITRMFDKHEPFPMLLLNRRYDLLRSNRAAGRMLGALVPGLEARGATPNIFELLFDPELLRPQIVGWERTARTLLGRLQREALVRGGDTALQELLRSLLRYPGVPREWHAPDLGAASDPCLALRFRAEGMELGFLVTVTTFDAPQNVTLEELRLESYFPLDDSTARVCEALSG